MRKWFSMHRWHPQKAALFLRLWSRIVGRIVCGDLTCRAFIHGVGRHLDTHSGLKLVHRCRLPFERDLRAGGYLVRLDASWLIDCYRICADRLNGHMVMDRSGSRFGTGLHCGRQAKTYCDDDWKDNAGNHSNILTCLRCVVN